MAKGQAAAKGSKAVVNSTLRAMLARWKELKCWADSEQEDPDQSLLYKSIEAILCFILPLELRKDSKEKATITEGAVWYLQEVSRVLGLIKTDGFDPNPYTYQKTKTNFVDCASSTLELLILTKKHLSTYERYRDLRGDIEATAKSACKFLHSASKKVPDGSIGWPNTDRIDENNSATYVNCYFTSFVVKALVLLENESPWDFVKDDSREIRDMIKGGLAWLLGRFDAKRGVYYFDTQGKLGSLADIGHVLLAIEAGRDFLTSAQQEVLASLRSRFIDAKEFGDNSGYITISYGPKAPPAFYDNRLTQGVVLAALCSIAGSAELPESDEQSLYSRIAASYSLLLNKRGAVSNLWDENLYLVTNNLYGILASLLFDKHGKQLNFELTESEIYGVIRVALKDARVARTLTQVVAEQFASLLAKGGAEKSGSEVSVTAVKRKTKRRGGN